MSNVIQLKDFTELGKTKVRARPYIAWVKTLGKHALLEEMIRYQEMQAKIGKLTLDMMVRGVVLFKCLEDAAESEGLQLLARSYGRHLKCELKERR